MIIKLIRKIVPKPLLSFYHYFLALTATAFYGTPSNGMLVIGITGTKGKTSTANFIWGVLNSNNYKTGIISTANIRIGDEEVINSEHMTMPGRFAIQKYLKKMKDEGCKAVIVETTSQGLAQHRHVGIWYDIAIFTNLSPEHIDSHGSFEDYKKAKGKMFKYLMAFPTKKLNGEKIPKTIIANTDSIDAKYFLDFKADKKITYSTQKESDIHAGEIVETESGISFKISGRKFNLSIPGVFNIYNALPAIAVGESLNLSHDDIAKGLQSVALIPGRMEEIKEGQKFRVFVDYAHEMLSLQSVLETGKKIKSKDGKVIVLIGAEGGGRDKAKGIIMGEIAGRLADVVVTTTTDPYDDDPEIIAESIADSSEKFGKVKGQNLFVIVDRREALRESFKMAKEGDVVIATGMGSQQNMIVKGKKLPWDDRVVVREELKKLNKN